jgi:hypothetical protein
VILSEDRQSHFARIIIDGIWNDDLVDYTDDDEALRAAKRAIARFVKDAEDIDKKVHEKIASLKRGVIEGSPEWDVMYSKYFDEEMGKRGVK